MRYEIRAATEADLDGLYELSRYLDSVNLPHNREEIEAMLGCSRGSFSADIENAAERQYIFVLYDREQRRHVGTSMVFAQLGRPGVPYIYLDVLPEEKYSNTLKTHFVHQVLRIGYSFDGPTEIGGLVMHPEYRRSEGRLGMMISYIRFLWIAMHRDNFRDEVLAELMPPLEADGTSHLWEAVGRRFTGLSYQEADKLSKKNKEFIRGLFPDGAIYSSLLSAEAQSVIGEVGPQTKGVEKLLRRIGFRYADRVDPFDGGPHFIAETGEISLIRDSRKVILGDELKGEGTRHLVAAEWDEAPFFRAASLLGQSDPSDPSRFLITASDRESLLGSGSELPLSTWVLPL
ncbi:MAG: arginine N-succinyltransferase [Myxococcales bacterium]|nr:arginine N-succinyltransferase [Myxococcales bacterium]